MDTHIFSERYSVSARAGTLPSSSPPIVVQNRNLSHLRRQRQLREDDDPPTPNRQSSVSPSSIGLSRRRSSGVPAPLSSGMSAHTRLRSKFELDADLEGLLKIHGESARAHAHGQWKLDRRRRSLWLMGSTLCLFGVMYCGVYWILPGMLIQPLSAPATSDSWDSPWPIDAPETLDSVHRTAMYNDQSTHILIPPSVEPASPLMRPRRNRLPADPLTSYYAHGMLPNETMPAPLPPVDVVFLWVNASDPYFQSAMTSRAESERIRIRPGTTKRFRDNGELRGAMRSVKASLKGLGNIHVLSGDYGVEAGLESDMRHPEPAQVREHHASAASEQRGWRIGQIPEWINWKALEQSMSGVRWHFHSNVWRIPVEDYDSAEEKALDDEFEAEWRAVSMPNFNSFAIETRVGWIEGLSENFVLANDDMFMMSEMSPTDFHHPLLGDVLRIDSTLLVKPELTPDLWSTPGEWGGLQHAAVLIARRFPSKSRGYAYHVPKSLTLSLAHEASVIWEEELTEAATRGFRRSARGGGDVEMSWLLTYLRVERWREALLWSWAVARLGGEDETWGKTEKEEVRTVLGIKEEEGSWIDAVMIRQGKRRTLDDIRAVDEQMGWGKPLGTQYIFSSMDGVMSDSPGHEDEDQFCLFSLKTCLPVGFFTNDSVSYSAEDMFIHMAFVEPECGDCMIKALITASGVRGLDAILPHPEQTAVPEERQRKRWERSEPMLPLVDRWQLGNFSLYSVIRPNQDQWEGTDRSVDGSINLRQWSIKLLSRYAYVLGSTNWRFNLIQNTAELSTAVASLGRDTNVKLACINDDQPDDSPEGVQEVFKSWMNEMWGWVDAKWERRTEKDDDDDEDDAPKA